MTRIDHKTSRPIENKIERNALLCSLHRKSLSNGKNMGRQVNTRLDLSDVVIKHLT